jgi:hypothetical protein
VQRAQLSARGGKVRCGKCGTVFDGVAGLIEEGADLPWQEPSPQLGLFDPSRRPAYAASPKGRVAGIMDDDATLPPFLVEPEPSSRSTLLWGVLAFLAVATLLTQITYRYRTEVAVLVPEARPSLAWACRFLQCQIALPRRPEQMSIDSSDLQSDGRLENVIILNAVLHNRAAFPQEYPSLELTLTDEADQPLLRRVLAPADYLEPAQASLISLGLAPGAEAALRVRLDGSRARAIGYRLYLFFPR